MLTMHWPVQLLASEQSDRDTIRSNYGNWRYKCRTGQKFSGTLLLKRTNTIIFP